MRPWNGCSAGCPRLGIFRLHALRRIRRSVHRLNLSFRSTVLSERHIPHSVPGLGRHHDSVREETGGTEGGRGTGRRGDGEVMRRSCGVNADDPIARSTPGCIAQARERAGPHPEPVGVGAGVEETATGRPFTQAG